MSKTFSVPIAIVVRTTTRAGRMLGTVMCRNMPSPLSPSSLAASMMSSGMALIDAERTVMANPVWIHTITMIRNDVFWGWLSSCLLYTSDAADEEDSVDLGGRRIIKKKKTEQNASK